MHLNCELNSKLRVNHIREQTRRAAIDTLMILFSSTLTDYTDEEQELYEVDVQEWKQKSEREHIRYNMPC